MLGLPGPDCIINPISCPGQVLGGATSGLADAGLNAVADQINKWYGECLKFLVSFWLKAPTPDLTSSHSVLPAIQAEVKPMTAFAMLAGVLVAVAVSMYETTRGQSGTLHQAGRGLIILVLVVGCGTLFIALLTQGFDQAAQYVLDHGFDGQGVGAHLNELAASAGPTLGPIFTIILSGAAGLASFLQLLVMIGRGPVMVVLLVAWPTLAAGKLTQHGGRAFDRVTSWLLSLALYKFVAAVVYATAFALISGSNDLTGAISGAMLLIIAIAALPAMFRLISPATQAIGSGGHMLSTGAALGGPVAGAVMFGGGRLSGPQTHAVSTPQPFSGGASGAGESGAATPPPLTPGGALPAPRSGGSAGGGGSSGQDGAAGSSGAGQSGASGQSGSPGAGQSGASGQSGSPGGSAPSTGAGGPAAGAVEAAGSGGAGLPADGSVPGGGAGLGGPVTGLAGAQAAGAVAGEVRRQVQGAVEPAEESGESR